jgi:hypothetical protein
MAKSYFEDYRRLVGEGSWLNEYPGAMEPGGNPTFLGGQADLTPLRNKAREAMDALADASKAADQGRVDDCLEYFRRAKAILDIALGGQIGPYGSQSTVTPRP